MAAAQARHLNAATGKKVKIVDKMDKARWNVMWEGLPYIARPEEEGEFVTLKNGSGCRPYVDYRKTTKEKWAYTSWRVPAPGEIRFNERERPYELLGENKIIIEPTLKANASPNKQWGRWKELVTKYPKLNWAQMGARPELVLPNTEFIKTPSFRHACAVIKGAKLCVLPEGGLHHAAAAVNTPAVVIFGGMTSPHNTGYHDNQISIYYSPDSPCGWRLPCLHCKKGMGEITAETVIFNVFRILWATESGAGGDEQAMRSAFERFVSDISP